MARPALPKKPTPVSPSRPLPSPARLWLSMAWGAWLKTVVIAAVVGLLILAWFLDWLPNDLAAGVVLLIVLLFPFYALAGKVWQARVTWWRGAVLALGVAVFAVAGYPLYQTLFPTTVFSGSFAKEGDGAPLPAVPGGPEWKAEVSGQMAPSNGAYEVSYIFKMGPKGAETNVKGELTRTWGKVKAGYKSIGKRLVDNDKRVTNFEGDFSSPGTVTLTKLSGALTGPLHLAVMEAPMSTWYFLVFGVPLILAAALLEATDEDGKRRPHLALATSFLAFFSAMYADFAMPDTWLNTLLFSALAAAVGGALLGWFLPKLFVPLWRAKRR